MLSTALIALLPLLALTSASPVHTKRGTSQLIQSGRRVGLCLSPQGGRQAVADGTLTNGTPVVDLACGVAAPWDISPGSGSVIVSGTNFALDLGLDPHNNGDVHIWQSYPGSPQQTWYLTDDNRIAITGGNQCLDDGDNGPQTYQCTTGNTNQVWNVRQGDFTPSSSVSPAPSSTSSVAPAPSTTGVNIFPNVNVGTTFTDPSSGGKRLHPYGRSDLCVTVSGGFSGVGAVVGITGCFASNDEFIGEQLWDAPNGQTGQIKLHDHPDLCLDAGSNPANGGEVKVWSCGGYPQQTWTYSSANTLQTANNQCLDVRKESTPGYQKPYNTVADLQTWECSTNGDPYQVFFELA